MVWYGMVTLFKHGISIRYTFTLKNRKTNFLTNAFKVWFNDASNGVNNRGEEQQQAETHVRCFEQRNEKKL